MNNIARYCISETRLILRGCKDKGKMFQWDKVDFKRLQRQRKMYQWDKVDFKRLQRQRKMFPQLVAKIPVTTHFKNTASRITFQIKTGIILNC